MIIDETQFKQLEQMRLSMFTALPSGKKYIHLDVKYFDLIDDLFYQSADDYSQNFIIEHY